MSIIKLTSRADYLESVKVWKEEYKATAARLREIRVELAVPHSSLGYAASMLQSEQARLRYKATSLLTERAEAKKQSWAAAQARKEALRRTSVTPASDSDRVTDTI